MHRGKWSLSTAAGAVGEEKRRARVDEGINNLEVDNFLLGREPAPISRQDDYLDRLLVNSQVLDLLKEKISSPPRCRRKRGEGRWGVKAKF